MASIKFLQYLINYSGQFLDVGNKQQRPKHLKVVTNISNIRRQHRDAIQNTFLRNDIRSKVICRVCDVYFSFIDTVQYSKSIEKYLLTEEDIQSQAGFQNNVNGKEDF